MTSAVVRHALRSVIVLVAAISVVSCGTEPRAGMTTVSIIGSIQRDTAVRAATGRGLVRLDASGQVVPDLAARWAIDDDGLDYIFRLEDGVDPRAVARRLRALVTTRGPLRSWLAPIASIDAVTATVVEIRLASPMPDLLALLARAELALPETPGPLRLASRRVGSVSLIGRPSPSGIASARITAIGERAGRAVARFAAGKSDAVLGGTFDDLAIARTAALPAGTLVFDAAEGLFGFAARSTEGPAADPAVMHALGLAIDRDRIAALVGGAPARKATTIAGSTLEPPLAERIAAARRSIPTALRLRVAMPVGPGARLLFRLTAQDWRRIGVEAVAVGADMPADLALIDIVVPPGEVARMACAVSAGCYQRDSRAMLDPTFIPLMQPVRWSLIAGSIEGFAANPSATHPLEYLRRVR